MAIVKEPISRSLNGKRVIAKKPELSSSGWKS